jgi:hypothetical protein
VDAKHVTVLVAVEPPLMRVAICEGLASDARIAVASNGPDPLEVLASAARIEPGVVIVTSSEPAGIPPLATHLFAEFPDITIIGICRQTGQVRVHRQVVTSETIPADSIERLVAAICAESDFSTAEAAAGLNSPALRYDQPCNPRREDA